MTAEDCGLTPELFQYYELGRRARIAGYPSRVCNIAGMNERRGAWLSGWHDEDIASTNLERLAPGVDY